MQKKVLRFRSTVHNSIHAAFRISMSPRAFSLTPHAKSKPAMLPMSGEQLCRGRAYRGKIAEPSAQPQ